VIGSFPNAVPTDVSAHGDAIVGYGTGRYGKGEAVQAFRWTKETGLVGLGFVSTAVGVGSAADLVSWDGSVVVGTSSGTAPAEEIFRWTPETGMVSLTPGFYGRPRAINAEGNIVAVGGWQRSGPGPLVHIFAPSGALIESHPIPADLPNKCCFGGAELDTLYVTTGGGQLFRAAAGSRRGRK
jgi:uncharacterized membrane protein